MLLNKSKAKNVMVYLGLYSDHIINGTDKMYELLVDTWMYPSEHVS